MTVVRCTARTPCAPTCRTGPDTFESFKVEPLEMIDAGQGQVVAVFRNSGRAKLSGVEVELTFAVVYTLSDGKIARGREYWTRDEALQAAGLSE